MLGSRYNRSVVNRLKHNFSRELSRATQGVRSNLDRNWGRAPRVNCLCYILCDVCIDSWRSCWRRNYRNCDSSGMIRVREANLPLESRCILADSQICLALQSTPISYLITVNTFVYRCSLAGAKISHFSPVHRRLAPSILSSSVSAALYFVVKYL